MKSKFIQYILYQFPWQLLMIAIFVQSSMGNLDLPDFDIAWSDKLLHFLVFGLLGLLLARGFYHSTKKTFQQKYLLIAIVLAGIYAASDEIHQYWVPGRYSDILDFVADVVGIFIFVGLYKLWQTHKKK